MVWFCAQPSTNIFLRRVKNPSRYAVRPKGEQIHQLARYVAYGKRGKISARDLQEQKNTCSCLNLIMACIIYWQSKEIARVIEECDPNSAGINLSMIEHISPIEWGNVILYGEYILNRNLVQ